MKLAFTGFLWWSIIPYQEPPGNYNPYLTLKEAEFIIPYQEPPGNYNGAFFFIALQVIIPYQEPPGNYNEYRRTILNEIDYTIPRTTGELQPSLIAG